MWQLLVPKTFQFLLNIGPEMCFLDWRNKYQVSGAIHIFQAASLSFLLTLVQH